MIEYIRFFTDKRLLSSIVILVCFELCLQAGAYKTLLKKNSYAANVNRIASHAVNMKSELDPDILIVGTSVAFEGLSVRILNDKLKSTGLKVQSLAIPGSELIVQDQILRENLPKFPNVKIILHVMEAGMPWVDRNELILPTLAMLSEINHITSIKRSYEYEYMVNWQDWFYLIFKSIAYRRDFKDFLTEPQERIKFLGRDWREPNENPWDYENPHTESIAAYNIKSLEECMQKTGPENIDPIPAGSTKMHKKMLYDTCALSYVTTSENVATERTGRYFRRLSKIYEAIDNKEIKIVHVFAPYSELIYHFGKERRMPLWKSELNRVMADTRGYPEAKIIDLESLLDGSENGKYCFDLIHLNRDGMEKFSNKLGDILNQRILENSL
ncbi:hypothetical protein [Leptospira sp. GIMC2001]|uniref:hypothetical protein n=1 Tax=Leptospira sp. GIMC2001 TaxID=1513297 RepID=UPI00234B08A3|nr:hypothetical protein [Leptospira sp. GIMC2001]WCL47638.1 hypothetical protein O4O04_01330 [Leptospira sp. GIMC2001]